MAFTKKEEFSKPENRVADFAKALSNPARISILKTLAGCSECICGEIVEVMPLSQSTVSQHLKELKNAGLIQGQVQGVTSCYRINWKRLESEADNFNKLIESLKEKRAACKPI